MEGSSKNLIDSSSHNKYNVKTNLLFCQPGKSDQDNGPKVVVLDSWEDIPDEVPQIQDLIFLLIFREETTCVDGSQGPEKASFVSTDNAETTTGSNGALEPTNTDGYSIVNHENSNNVVHASSPISKSNESLDVTATVVATKLSHRKKDKVPP